MRSLVVLVIGIAIGIIASLERPDYLPADIGELYVRIFPLVPSTWMHVVGYYSYWFLTSVINPLLHITGIRPFQDCFENGPGVNIIVTTLKSGTVLSSLLGFELALVFLR